MTSSITAFGPATTIGEAAATGLRRSRFSFHLNTPRRRRWLLVQLVSVPDDSKQKNEAELCHSIRSRTDQPSLTRLVDDFRAAYSFNRCI
ncbi:MAG: hypothetical protein ABIO92_00490 [Chloroflexia bacterium]